jgi:hypothetical protein
MRLCKPCHARRTVQGEWLDKRAAVAYLGRWQGDVREGVAMTESEWMECTDPIPMVEFLRGKVSDRKLRLFVSAICGGVDVAERHADGNATDEELEEASLDAYRGMNSQAMYFWGTAMTEACQRNPEEVVVEVIRLVMLGDRHSYDKNERLSYGGGRHDDKEQDAKYNRDLIRCVFGPLTIRPVAVNPAWLTSTVLNVAQAAYENRIPPSGELVPARRAVWANDPGTVRQWGMPSGELDPLRLAVLADALEDGGCADADVLNHLRGPGPHGRGCWVVDLLLGRE